MMDWRIEIEKDAIRDLEKISSAFRQNILEKLDWLQKNFSEITPAPLGGEWKGFYKLRVGDYRVIYDVNWSTYRIIVVVVDHRSCVYRRKRK